ncbi:hypothetical protein C5S35_02770, partial [Candidatus Methanophagaceae archaeon]
MVLDTMNLKELCNAVITERNVPNKKEWGKNLSHFLIENKDAFFTVIQPGGNNGDELIYKGLNKKLRDINIVHKEEKYREGKHSRGLSLVNKRIGTNLKEVNI